VVAREYARDHIAEIFLRMEDQKLKDRWK
jgi:hypothetical protein